MTCELVFGIISDIIRIKLIGRRTKPTWNPEFDTMVSVSRRFVTYSFRSIKAEDIPTLRKYMDKLITPKEALPAGIRIEEGANLGNISTLPSYEYLYPDHMGNPSFSGDESNRQYVLYFHGGAFCLNRVNGEHRNITMSISKRSGATVVAINYRRAPEHKHPTAENDCFDSYKWLIERVSANNVFIAGDSAGGSLAINTLCRIRDEGLPLPRGAILLSPWVDMFNISHESFQSNECDSVTASVATLASFYIDPPTDKFSPSHQDLKGLPKLLVEYGEAEVLRDQIREFVDKARKQGVEVIKNEYSEMPHVFQLFCHTGQAQCNESFEAIKNFMSS